MPDFDALRACGMVVCPTGNHPYFLGSCFAFRSPDWFVTAAHCVGDLPPSELAVNLPRAGVQTSVESVQRHPAADIALLHVPDVTLEWTEPFWLAVSNYALGEDFFAFGFPENILGAEARQPTARLFKGHIQRVFAHDSFAGYRYRALELNMPSPGGLSGGPLFRPGAHVVVIGVATENFQSTTQLHGEEEVVDGGERRATRYREVISYGLALALDSVLPWIDEHVPEEHERDVAAIREARKRFSSN